MEEEKNILKRINYAADCVSLLQKKKEITNRGLFEQILKEIEETESLLQTTNSIMEESLDALNKEYIEISKKIRNQQSEMIKYMLKIKKAKIEKEKMQQLAIASPNVVNNSNIFVHSALKNSKKQLTFASPFVNSSVPRTILHSALKNSNNINLSAKSPSAHHVKFNLTKFEAVEFVANITSKTFDDIPKYMKGRISYDEFQNFLNQTIISCFNEKYKLMQKPYNVVQRTKDFEMYKLYHSQVSYAAGSHFITAGDISRKLNKMIDKKMNTYLVMMRHIGILNEVRASSTICYIWKAST